MEKGIMPSYKQFRKRRLSSTKSLRKSSQKAGLSMESLREVGAGVPQWNHRERLEQVFLNDIIKKYIRKGCLSMDSLRERSLS